MRRLLPTLIVLSLAACTGGESSPNGVTREQRGDTTVLRYVGDGSWGAAATLEPAASVGEAEGSDSVTLGGILAIAIGDDGRVFATDGQRKSIRVFDASLKPIGLWGRDGAGPGELRNPDGGLAVLSDGRVAVRDPGNARLQLFAGDGSSAAEFRVIDAGLRTHDNFGLQGDTLLSRVVVDYTGPIDQWKYGFARLAPDGRVLDTLRLPESAFTAPSLVARRGNNTAELPLPFAPTSIALWHPGGGFLSARGDRYAITWPRADGFLRVEREVPATAVTAAEAAQERAYVTKGLQWLDPTWAWTGPDIPATKPFLSRVFVGTDGSVWALREGEAKDADDPDFEPNEPSSVERRLRSTLSFDVFSSDGEFLGTLAKPEALQLRPQPAFSLRGLVGLEIDTLGVPRLVRYDVKTPAPR